MARSLNKVTLIGNLTRDPELRYTPAGAAVCTFGLATNRQWSTDSGEKKEDVEFHRVVSWQKLAELCGQLLSKGRKVYVEGRLQTRKWTGKDEVERTTTEIVIHEMIILDSKGAGSEGMTPATPDDFDIPDETVEDSLGAKESGKRTMSSFDNKITEKSKTKTTKKSAKSSKSEQDDDIPF